MHSSEHTANVRFLSEQQQQRHRHRRPRRLSFKAFYIFHSHIISYLFMNVLQFFFHHFVGVPAVLIARARSISYLAQYNIARLSLFCRLCFAHPYQSHVCDDDFDGICWFICLAVDKSRLWLALLCFCFWRWKFFYRHVTFEEGGKGRLDRKSRRINEDFLVANKMDTYFDSNKKTIRDMGAIELIMWHLWSTLEDFRSVLFHWLNKSRKWNGC